MVETFCVAGDDNHCLTAIGRATLQLLAMNEPSRIDVRDDLRKRGESFAG
jgi:hypothetical protein